ncbi:MAG: helix-turn-helix domain-containing protein [Armatimonadetes bacterium]|nr:helix-turn-helix domain-containing protein [Armatimonadota bacterium]
MSRKERLLKVSEVCTRLAVSRSLLYRLVAAGEIKKIKISGATRIAESELDRYINLLMQSEDE